MGGAKKEYYLGCIGCVDFNIHGKFCDYLDRNGRVRPCPAGAKGCRLKSLKSRKKTDPPQRTWDTERAGKLLAEGMTRKQAAEELKISVNELSSWIFQRESGCVLVAE